MLYVVLRADSPHRMYRVLLPVNMSRGRGVGVDLRLFVYLLFRNSAVVTGREGNTIWRAVIGLLPFRYFTCGYVVQVTFTRLLISR